jgi:uncharacterized membrane protein YqiK
LIAIACPFRTPEEDLVPMRRKYLLSVAMLSVLLATSACEAGHPAPVASPQAAGLTGSGTGAATTGQPEIGISQWNAAQAAKAAETKPAAASKAEPAAQTKPAAPAKAKSDAKTKPASTADPTPAAKTAGAKAAAAAEKAAAAAAKKEAAAQKEAAAKKKAAKAAGKTQPATGGLKRVTPIPVTPKTAPAPVHQGSAEQSAEEIVRSACETADTLYDNALEGPATIGDPVLPVTVGGTGTDAGTMDKFRCLD